MRKERKPAEPSSFTLSNMSRVTPLQLPHIFYSAEGRYQPIRPIGDPSAGSASTSTKKPSGPTAAFGGLSVEKPGTGVGSGSIIMLRETSEGEGGYIELDRALWPEEAEQVVGEVAPDAQAAPAEAIPQEAIEEAEMPPPFEFNFDD